MSKHRRKNENDGIQYIQKYPHLKKWINQCVCCQATGYKPDMPKHDAAYNIKKFFKPLAINELGLCDVCEIQFK